MVYKRSRWSLNAVTASIIYLVLAFYSFWLISFSFLVQVYYIKITYDQILQYVQWKFKWSTMRDSYSTINVLNIKVFTFVQIANIHFCLLRYIHSFSDLFFNDPLSGLIMLFWRAKDQPTKTEHQTWKVLF